MHDQQADNRVPPSTQPAAILGQQFSLAELFFVVTLLAIELGVYLHVSELLAILPAAGLLLVAAIRFGDVHNFLLGSIVGYFVWLLVAWLYVQMYDVSAIVAACIFIFAPAAGYIGGGFLAELQNID